MLFEIDFIYFHCFDLRVVVVVFDEDVVLVENVEVVFLDVD